MRDARLNALARLLIRYSTATKKGDIVRIGGELPGLPLMEALFEEAVLVGAHPFFQLASDTADDAFFRLASEEQLAFVSPVNQFIVENIDVYLGVWADENTKSRSNVPAEKQALASKARKPFLKRLLARAAEKKLRWTGTQYPTNASAQDAEMSLYEYQEFVFKAGLLHLPDPVAAWRALSEKQQRLADHLMTKREVHVRVPAGKEGKGGGGGETDLRLAIAGRTWINCDGHENFPDGEVFTAPVEDSVNGVITYPFPGVHLGKEVHDIRLVFKDGKVVDAGASKGEEFLIQMLDQDAGARTLGEFAIGTNFGIKQYTRNTLFDEKIGGTCHAALGNAYPESGGTNESALHWDMVCDLRGPGAEIVADGEVIVREGKFTKTEWPS